MNYYNTYEIDLFVNLSTIEGVPVSIMEAQSSGIPVLATDVGSSKEIVDDDNGFLIPKDFEMNLAQVAATYNMRKSTFCRIILQRELSNYDRSRLFA